MRNSRLRAAAFALVLASSAASALYGAQGGFRASIGTRHATVSLDGSWRRSSFIKDGGKDQFERIGKSQYFFIMEEDGLVPSRRAAKETVDTIFKRISSTEPNAVRGALDGWSGAGGIVERCRIDMRVNGVSLSYLILCFSGYGSSYTFVSWSTRQGFAALEDEMNGIVRSLDATLSNERYALWISMRGEYAWLDDAEVRLDYPSRLLAPAETEDPLMSLEGDSGNTLIELAADARSGPEPKDAFSKRGTLRVASLGVLPYEYSETSDDGSGRLSLRIPPRFAGEALTLRVSADLEEESLKDLASWLVGSLEAARGPSVLPYPRATPDEEGDAEDALRNLLAASRLEATLAGQFRQGGRSGPDVWIATSKGLWRAGNKEPKADLGADSVKWSDRYVDIGGTLYRFEKDDAGAEKVGASEGDPLAAAEHDGTPLGFRKDFGIVSVEERPREGSLAALWKPARPALRLRFDASGATRDLSLDSSAGLPTGAVGAAGILLAESPDYDREGSELVVLASPRGEWRSLGKWSGALRVSATDEGWLIQGKPEGGRAGTWLALPSGSRTLALGGDELEPVAVLGGRLWYASRFKDERGAAGDWDECRIRSVDLKTAATLGPAIGLVDAGMLNRCGSAISSSPLTTARDVADARRVLDEKAAGLGAALPRGARAVDRLIDRARGDADLDEGGFAALLVLLAGSLLDKGAEWVEAPCPRASSASQAARWDASDLSTRAFLLPGLLSSALYDDEGWYEPASEIEPIAEDGRRVLIGLSVDRLRARSGELAIGSLEDRMRKAESEIAAWLLLPDNAPNLRLREAAYEFLFDRPDRAKLTGLLDAVARRAPSSLEPYYRLLLDLEGPTALGRDDRLARLREVLRSRRDDPLPFFLLGQAWEEGQAERGAEAARALACYRKALNLSMYKSRYAELKARADEAIKRIERNLAPDAVIEEDEV